MTRSLQSRGHVDAVPLFEAHDGALHVGLLSELVAESLPLAAADQGVDALDLDVEQLLHRFLDLWLGGALAHLERHLVVLGRHGRLLSDHRSDDDVVMARIAGAHLKRASSASSAALVRTRVLRRRMST